MNKKLIPVLVTGLLISITLVSCFFGMKGSGNVVKSERQVETFGSVSVSAGIEVILMQDSVLKVMVEADDNLQENIKTEVTNGMLKIYPRKPIRSCTAKKVFVSIRTIQSLEASSGSEVLSKLELKLPSLELSSSSGARVNLALAVNMLNVESSSGADIRLSGSAENLDVDGSGGANVNASALQSKTCNAGASSGANLKVYASEKIVAKASSGGNIKVAGNPKDRNIGKSSGGAVNFN